MGAVQTRDFIVCVRCFSANPVRINTSSVIELTLSGSLPCTYGSGETGRLSLWGALFVFLSFFRHCLLLGSAPMVDSSSCISHLRGAASAS